MNASLSLQSSELHRPTSIMPVIAEVLGRGVKNICWPNKLRFGIGGQPFEVMSNASGSGHKIKKE